MSNIGKKPIAIKDGTQVTLNGKKVIVVGPKGTLEFQFPGAVEINIADGQIQVKKTENIPEHEKFVGLTRALVANMVTGVTTGFEKKLELSGVGYRARVEGKDLVLNIGFANPVKLTLPEGLSAQVAENIITISGINKQLIGDFAAVVRKVRPPDSYKGKGIRYYGEKLRKKVGKAAKAVGAK